MSGNPKDMVVEARPRGADADDVAAYLRDHPDFFIARPELLEALDLPSAHEGPSVVDFQRYQLELRNAEIDELRNCAQDVIETSRSNMSVQTRTHSAVLALLHVSSAAQLFRVALEDLPLLLDVDTVTIGFEPSETPDPALIHDGVRQLPEGTVNGLIGTDNDVALYKEFWDDGSVFGSAAGLVKSAAVARLRPGMAMPAGLLALGSRDALFHPRQGTEMLSFLARVFQACVLRFREAET